MKRLFLAITIVLSLAPASAMANVRFETPNGPQECTNDEIPVAQPLQVDPANVHGSYCVAKQSGNDAQTNPIIELLRRIIQFASALVLLGVVLMLVWEGIGYITSGDNPSALADHKNKIVQALIGLGLYILMFGVLNYLIPGGVLG